MFRTEIDVANAGVDLTLQDKVLTIGSCFAEVIGNKLLQNKVDVLANPFGTIFNPVSVCRLLGAATGTPYKFEDNLIYNNGIWYAYDLHSSVSSPAKEDLLQTIQARVQLSKQYLQQSSLLIITLGTAIAYQLKQTAHVVANCHKLPASNFSRVLLNLNDTKALFEQTIASIKKVNPAVKIVLTVSPVRHVKETLTMNSVSKAELRLLCHYLQEDNPDVLYFPAYEVMMDDLRDYRFYKDDLLHPTSMAENYIWDKFIAAYYQPSFTAFTKDWDKIRRALAHKPFHPASESHQLFIKNTLKQLQQLGGKYNIDTSAEQQLLQSQLISG